MSNMEWTFLQAKYCADFFIAGPTMGGRKQKCNKIETIIATLNLFLHVFIDLFLVISFLNGRRQMIVQF